MTNPTQRIETRQDETSRLGLARVEAGRPYREHDAVAVTFDAAKHGICSLESCATDLETLGEVWELDGEGFCSDACAGEHVESEHVARAAAALDTAWCCDCEHATEEAHRESLEASERDFLANPGSPPEGFTPERVRRAKLGMAMARRRLGVA